MANYPLEMYIVVPEAAVNVIANPSFETGADGWAIVAGGISTSTSAYRRGRQALAISPSASGDVVYYSVPLTSGTTYNLSLDILTTDGVTYTIGAVTSGHAFQTGKTATLTGDGHWQRVWLTFAADASSAGVGISSSTSGGYHVDGVCLVASAENQLYFDGDYGRNDPSSPREYEFRWTGTPHASTSERAGRTRKGGYLLRFSDYAKILTVSGMGMSPYAHVYVGLAEGGALYQRSVSRSRQISVGYSVSGADVSEWGAKIAVLQRALSPDLTAPRQAVRTVWVHEDDQGRQMSEAVILDVTLDAGLEGIYTAPTYARGVLSLTAGDPLLTAEAVGGVSLDSQQTLTAAGLLARTPSGEWTTLGTTMTGGGIYAMLILDGYLYVGGNFTDVNSVAGTAYFARYHIASQTWESCSTTALNDMVRALAGTPGGIIYLGGDFTNIGGDTNADRIIAYNPQTGVYSKLSSDAPSGYVTALLLQAQTLYASGPFGYVGSLAVNGFARYDTVTKTWSTMGAGMSSLPAQTYQFAEFPFAATRGARKIIAAGDFSISASPSPIRGTAIWNGSSWSRCGDASAVYCVENTTDGMYIGGVFADVGGVAAAKIARYNGFAWSALGSGITGTQVDDIIQDVDGRIWVTGNFSAAGGLTVRGLAIWDGETWQYPPVTPPSGTYGAFRMLAQDGWLILSAFGNWIVPASNAVTVSHLAYPTFRASGPETLREIRNASNGAVIRFAGGGVTLSEGETLTISCSPTGISVLSDTRGSMSYALDATSSTVFRLEAGSNTISALTDGGAQISLELASSFAGIEGTLR